MLVSISDPPAFVPSPTSRVAPPGLALVAVNQLRARSWPFMHQGLLSSSGSSQALIPAVQPLLRPNHGLSIFSQALTLLSWESSLPGPQLSPEQACQAPKSLLAFPTQSFLTKISLLAAIWFLKNKPLFRELSMSSFPRNLSKILPWKIFSFLNFQFDLQSDYKCLQSRPSMKSSPLLPAKSGLFLFTKI